MNIEAMRELHKRPLDVIELAQPLMTELGVTASATTAPNMYIEQLDAIDPRKLFQAESDATSMPLEEQAKEKMSRQALQERAQGNTDNQLASFVMNTAGNMGLTIKKYPFDAFAEEADVIVVTSGVAPAIGDRTDFAFNEGPDVPIFVIGGPRSSTKSDAPYLESVGQSPEDFKTQGDVATFVASSYDDERVQAHISRITVADNLDVVREFVTRNPQFARFALVTTGLYIPSLAGVKGAVEAEFGGAIEAEVYAGASDPVKVAARPTEIYLTDIIKTAADHTRYQQALIRRRML